MPAETFFANNGVLKVDNTTLAVVQGVEITPKMELVKLYGFGSIKWQDIARHSFTVDVKIKYAKFDPTVSTDWLMKVLNPSSPDGTVADTNTAATFTIVADFVSRSGSVYRATVSYVTFSEIPQSMNMNEFVVRDLTGEGKDIVFAYPAT